MAENTLSEGVRLFEEKMASGLYKEAAKVREDRSLPLDMLQEAATKAYRKNVDLGEYSVAAALAKLYDLPENLIKGAAIRSICGDVRTKST